MYVADQFSRIVDYVLKGLEDDVPTAVAEWYYPSIGGAPDHDAADLPLFIFLRMKLDDLSLVCEAWRIGGQSYSNTIIQKSPDY